jgi:hypothetical protein
MNSSNLPEPSAIEIQLRQKLAAVLAAPIQSAQRAKAMSSLLRIVMHLPGIKRVAHQDYLLALNQTWEWMSRNIDEFQSSTDSLENDLVKWINGYLYWRIRDIYHSVPNRQQTMSLDEEIFDNGETYLELLSESGFLAPNLNNLNEHIQLLQQQEDRKIATQIEVWIQLDPERQLQDCYPRDRHYCNCQVLSYRIIVKDPLDSLTDIAKELSIPYQTLVAHWKRRCLPLLQAQAQSFGYEPNGSGGRGAGSGE